MKRLAALIAALCMLAPAAAFAGTERVGREKEMRGSMITTFEITPQWAVDDFTTPVPVCPSTLIIYEKSAAGVVSAYGTKTTDDTTAEIEAASLIQQFTTSTTTSGPVTVSKGSMEIRFVVDTAETSLTVPTKIRVICSGLASGGGGGVVLVTESTLPVSGDPSKIYRITNATNGGDCAAGTPGTEQADCRWNGTAYESLASGVAGISNVSEDLTPSLGGDLDADNFAISDVGKIESRNYYVSTEAEWEDALDDADADGCGDGVGVAGQSGCTINLVGAVIDVADGVTLCGATAGTQGRNGLVIRGMGGGPSGNVNNNANGGTVVRWTGSNGGDLLSVGACNMLEIANVTLAGESCVDAYLGAEVPQISDGDPGEGSDGFCDSDGSTSQTKAANAIQVLNNSGGPAKIHFHNGSVYGFSDYAIKGNTSGQWDESHFHDLLIYDTNGIAHIQDDQSVGLVFGPNVVATIPVESATNPFYYIEYGDALIRDSFLGFNANNQVGVRVGLNATSAQIHHNYLEGKDYAGIVYIDLDESPSISPVHYVSITENEFKFYASGQVALDAAFRGRLDFSNNAAIQIGAGTDLTPPSVTIERDAGSAPNRLWLTYHNNTITQTQTSYLHFPRPWIPTIGAGVYADTDNLATATLPNTAETDCIDGQLGVDIDDGSLKTCENDAWIDPPNLLALATSTATYVPYYVTSNSLGTESTFTYNNATNTLRSSIVQASTTLVAGVDDTADGSITLHDNSTNNQINIFAANPTADLDFILPDDYGLNGDCILTDGAGTLYFGACGAGGSLVSTDIDTSAELDAIVTDDTGSGALVFATSPTLTTPNIGAATATTPAAEDSDTSVATTAYVQGEFDDLGAFTVGTTAPTDGSTACALGDQYLDEAANKIYWCVDDATDDWFGVALADTP